MSYINYEKNFEMIIAYKQDEINKSKLCKNQNIKTATINKTRIFGEKFAKNNKDKLKIIYKNHDYELTEYLEDIDKNFDFKDYLILKLSFMNNNIDLSYMFFNCNSLFFISDNLNENTLKDEMDIDEIYDEYYKYNETEMLNNMIKSDSSLDINDSVCDSFYQCSKEKSSIQKKNINNITNMSDIIQINDILSYDSNFKVIDMSNIFYGCTSLTSLPDISKWDTSNVNNMSNIFCGCTSLISLPDISK